MNKKQQTISEIRKDRAEKYGPEKPGLMAIGIIQGTLTQYCYSMAALRPDINNGQPTSEALAHLANWNLVSVKMVRSVYNPGHMDNYLDSANYVDMAQKAIFDDQVKPNGLNGKRKPRKKRESKEKPEVIRQNESEVEQRTEIN